MKTIKLKTTFYCDVDTAVAKEALHEYNLGLRKRDQLKWNDLETTLADRDYLTSYVSCGAGNTLAGGNDVDGHSFVEWVLDNRIVTT